MLGGPGLLVMAGIALLIFGPKKLPELAKTIGRALGEFKKAAEEMKEGIGVKELQEMKGSIGIRELQQMRSRSFSRVDLISEFAERLSDSVDHKETNGESLTQGRDSTRPITQNKEDKK